MKESQSLFEYSARHMPEFVPRCAPERELTSALSVMRDAAVLLMTFSLTFIAYLSNLAAAGAIAGATIGLVLARANPLKAMLAAPLPWLLTAWILISVSWSSDPGYSLYEALQYVATCLIGVALAVVAQPRKVIAYIAYASLVALAISALSRNYAVDEHGAVALVGIFGSKNNLAYYATVGLLAGLSTAIDARQAAMAKVASYFLTLLATYVIIQARSMGTIVLAAASAAGLVFAVYVTKMGTFTRSISTIFALIGAIAIVAAGMVYTDQVLELLGKNSNLTGRAYLWARGWQYIDMRPITGTGFYDFWRQGYLEAEGLWRQMDIASRMGFTFHNAFINAGVELGYPGMVLIGLFMAAGAMAAVRWLMVNPGPECAFFLAFLGYSIPRLFIEVDVPALYGWGTIIVIYICTTVSRLGGSYA